MGKPKGFLEHGRKLPVRRPIRERIRDFSEFEGRLPVGQVREQGSRCMDCGIPFCHTGCPLGNVIPDWNDHVYRDRWQRALVALHSTNNFPEVTGRVCPAPCENACTLNIHEDPVTIKMIEREIADRGLEEGWVKPEPPEQRTGRAVAVIGSGPAGLACAQQLARAGHEVTVFERDDRIGGLLRYGIPDFKMEKHLIDRRMEQMEAEGVHFKPGVHVGVDVTFNRLRDRHDALVLATGATRPRDLPIPGRELLGVHFAMPFLTAQNRAMAGDSDADIISAGERNVVILGGGDTGSDCLGTSLRQGAKAVQQIELMRKPPAERPTSTPWPELPMVLRTSSSQEEGGGREWSILSKRFEGRNGKLERIIAVRVEWDASAAIPSMKEVPGSEFEIPAELCLLALGFLGPEAEAATTQLGVKLDARGHFAADCDRWATNIEGVFACGDARRGQSLVVWAIWEGRETARAVDAYLQGGKTRMLPSPENIASAWMA